MSATVPPADSVPVPVASPAPAGGLTVPPPTDTAPNVRERGRAPWWAVHRWGLAPQVALALALSIVVGALVGPRPGFLEALKILGDLFLDALRMMVVPLIVAAMIHAVLGPETPLGLTRLGRRIVLYVLATTALAVVTALVLNNVVRPGIIDGAPAGPLLGLGADPAAVAATVARRTDADFAGLLHQLVPANVVKAALDGNMLGLIAFALLFGLCAARLPPALAGVQRKFWESFYETVVSMTGWIMRFAPIGVFALVTRAVAQTGWGALKPLLLFALVVAAGLAIQIFVWLGLFLRAYGLSPVQHLKAMAPVLLTAFSTSSSAATLPITLDAVQTRAGVSPRISGFVLTLGATLNSNGTALYECAAALFIAQAYGLPLPLGVQVTVVLLSLATSIGVAGIPSASLVSIALILGAIGLPLEGIGMIMAVDRILDMCRTAVNVYGDTVGAAILAKLEGETLYRTAAMGYAEPVGVDATGRS